jgi:hypothetical protein
LGLFVKGDHAINSWVARIAGKSLLFSYSRENIPANGGISHVHSFGERTWYLPSGVYEFNLVSRSGTISQTYGKIDQELLSPLTKQEVVQWVNS